MGRRVGIELAKEASFGSKESLRCLWQWVRMVAAESKQRRQDSNGCCLIHMYAEYK